MADQQPLFTNHLKMLVVLALNPRSRLREAGDQVGVTERAAHRIIGELERDGYLTRERFGRRNYYTLKPRAVLRALEILEPLTAHVEAPAAQRRAPTPGRQAERVSAQVG